MADVALEPERCPRWLRPLVGSTGDSDGGEAQSAVLILFTGDPDADELPEDAAVLITHRHPSLRTHSGQMAFPGGHIDPDDAGPVDAALREAVEETGIDRSRVMPLATLDIATTGVTRKRVRPVLAYAQHPGEVYPASPVETDDVFFAPVRDFIDPDNRIAVRWGTWSGPAFWLGCYLVWGFTGALMGRLLERAGWALPWDDHPGPLAEALAASCNGERNDVGR